MKMTFHSMLAAILLTAVSCGSKENPQPVSEDEPYTPSEITFAKGADLGWITEMESKNYAFYDADGNATECTALFKSLGFNSVRQRVWVNPTDGWCSKEDLLVKCRRVSQLGMGLMIDFHLSDWWADPGKQNKPAAWKDYDVDKLASAVADHVTEVLKALKAENIDVTWVQIGNEVTGGMLWETCRVKGSDANNFVKCFKAGAAAAKKVYPSAKVVLHIDNAWKWETLKWFYDLMKSYSLDYDIIGLSLYPSYWDSASGSYPDWNAKTAKAVNNFQSLYKAYGKDVMLVEFGMPASLPDESAAALQYILDKTASWTWFKGIFLWEPESEMVRNGYAYGAFKDGRPTAALDPFKN